MKNKSNISFQKNYKIRETIWKLLGRIVFWEGFLFLLLYLGVISIHEVVIPALGIINLFGLSGIVLTWLRRFYIVSEEGISKTTGLFFRKTKTFDMGSIASVKVRQGILGQILNYGELILENPLTKEDLIMKDINLPYKQATLIEKQRLLELSKNPGKKVVPL